MQQEPFSSIEDFIFNSSFRSWLLDNDSVHKEYWENWIAENPDKVPVLNYAKAIVFALTVNHRQLSETEIDNEIKRISRQTGGAKRVEEKVKEPSAPERSMNPAYKKIAIAASVIAIVVFSIFYFRVKPMRQASLLEFHDLYSLHSSSIVEQSNNSDSIQPVALFDGSIVRLYPRSKLSFSNGSFSTKRDVYLSGEAFFEVKENPSVPFLVYTKHLVTKVLGTTFKVDDYSDKKRASVKVGMGKVSVYRKENFADKNAVANKLDGLIITSNQQAVYDVVDRQLIKGIIDKPAVLVSNAGQTFVFNSTPLKEILRMLEDAYGITIVCANSITNSCSLSVSMSNKNFYEKLELICKAVNASYEAVDGTILISSPGCN